MSHPERVMYPETGMTKADVVAYCTDVAPALLNQLRDRPVTRVRFPHGVGGERFFEKNTPRGAPDWLRHRLLHAAPGGPDEGTLVDLPFLDDIAGLVWAANLGVLELHTPQWTVGPRGGVRRPDRLVIDLDPQGNASTALGIDHHADVPDIYEVVVEGRPLAEVVQKTEDFDQLYCAPATLDLAGAYELHPKVALRPERFGALAYSYETRRLSLLKDPLLADVVRGLAGAPTAGAALDAVPAERRAAVTKALDRLVETGFVVPRVDGQPQPAEVSAERTP